MTFFKTEKGINLHVIQSDKFKTITIAILFKQKLDRKTSTLNALLPPILYKGCEKYKTIKEICIKTEQMYGASFYTDIMKKGDYHFIEFLIEFIPEYVDLCEIVDFLKEVILFPLKENNAFKKQYFEIAKQDLIDSIKNRLNDKKEYAKIRTIEEMFKNETFGISADGYLEDLEKGYIDEKTLFEHYKKIISESEIHIISIGNINKDNFQNIIIKNFINEIESRSFKELQLEDNLKKKEEPNFITESFNITQGKICVGFRTEILPESELFFPLLVGNEILGGGAGSKLFINVREKESLCYYINSIVLLFKGVLLIQSGIEFNQFDNVLTNIKREVEKIKNGEFDNVDISNAIVNIEKNYKSILDHNVSIMDFYLTNFLAKLPYSVDEFISKIKAVKKEDIVKAFKNIWLDTCYFMKGDKF